MSVDSLTTLSLPVVYDADPRPTFIVDILDNSRSDGFVIAYSNTALNKQQDLISCLDDAKKANTGLHSWISTPHNQESYYRYGGVLWLSFLLHDRWKVCSTASPLTSEQGNELASYETTIIQLKDEIRKCEHECKQAIREGQSHREAIQRLQEERRVLELSTPRSSLSKVASTETLQVAKKLHLDGEPHPAPVDPSSQSSDFGPAKKSPDPFWRQAGLPAQQVKGSDDRDAMIALEKFQQLAEAVDVGFFDYDLTGRLLHANDSWYALSGHPRDPELHTVLSFQKCVYPDDNDLVLEQWHKLLKGQPVTFEMRWRKPPPPEADPDAPDGAQWVLSACVPVYDEEGVLKSISGCTTDINPQKLSAEVALQRAEALERARASEERFARFAEVAPIAIFRFDKHKNMEYCNDRWFEMTGLPKSRFQNIRWPFGVFDDDINVCSQAWDKAITEQSVGQIEFRLRKEWHDTRGRRGQAWVYCTFFPEYAEDGTFNGLMGSLLDISHLKWAENMQKLRAEEALEAKRQQENFIDITSHEMRNPLSAMVQCSDTVVTALTETSDIMARTQHLRSAEDNSLLKDNIDTGMDAVQTILSCAAHQKRIVDDILTLSKLDSNLLLITPVKTDPVVMVQMVLKMFEMDSSKAGVELFLEPSLSFQQLGLQWLMLDPSRVSQILINLVGNAIKFTKTSVVKQIAVRMSASLDPPSRNDMSIEYVPAESAMDDMHDEPGSDGGEHVYLKFEVQDTGCGLTPEQKEKLFLRFSQASPKTHVQYGGSGLGLFISRKLTEMQGGEIGLASEAEMGSIFAFYIKTRRTTAPTAELESDPPYVAVNQPPTIPSHMKVDRKALNVLLVEDNLVNQKVLSKQLQKQGCTVFIAGHGGEALEFLQNTQVWAREDASIEEEAAAAAGISSSARASFSSSSSPPPLRRQSSTPMNNPPPVTIDVVLMDIEMPIMGGLECTRRIRHLEARHRERTRRTATTAPQHLPIISISANARQEQVHEARRAGVDDTITKPFRIRELMPKLDRLAAATEAAGRVAVKAAL